MRLQTKRIPTSFFVGVALAATAGAQTTPAPADLVGDLAARILALVPPGARLALTRADDDAGEPIDRDLASRLAARGLRIVAADANPAATVTVGCGANLRERACVADVRRGDTRDTVSAVAPYARPTSSAPDARVVAIEATPLFRQRDAILDVAVLGDRLFVLDPSALTLYRRAGDEWQRVDSRAIAAHAPWPRDMRGRVRVANGIDAFLPGVTCRAPIEFTSLSCADQREPWPLAVENAGLAGVRNAFQTPEGAPFFSAASLDAAAEAHSAIVDGTGRVQLIDDARKPVATIGEADDVASITAACGGVYLVASGGPTDDKAADTLRVWRIVRQRAAAAGTPMPVAGTVTALWAAEGARVATAVVHDSAADRYEAFQIRLACDR